MIPSVDTAIFGQGTKKAQLSCSWPSLCSHNPLICQCAGSVLKKDAVALSINMYIKECTST